LSLRDRLKKTTQTSQEPERPAVVQDTVTETPAQSNTPTDSLELSKGEQFDELKSRIHSKLVGSLNINPHDRLERAEIAQLATQFVDKFLKDENIPMGRSERQALVKELVEEIMGHGPIEPLLLDPTISEIMINGFNNIYVERDGKLYRSRVRFRNEAHLMHIIERIVSSVGRRVDEKVPMVDARLKAPGQPYDGSRFNAIIPPLAIDGASVTIRKFKKDSGTLEKLIAWGSLTDPMAQVLMAAAKCHLNIIISGGTGSGKTTMLNSLSAMVSSTERIVTIEDAAELQLQQPHVVRLESRPANIEGEGAIPIRQLLKNCLRMRPDRIIVGECRGGETLDMLQAMNTGHDGSLTTLHANSPRDALARIETMCLMNDNVLPEKAIRQQISSAVHLIVQVSRLMDGSRKTTSITEIVGMEGDTVSMQEIFKFEQLGLDDEGRVMGVHVAMGVRPKFADICKAKGIELPTDIFQKQDAKEVLLRRSTKHSSHEPLKSLDTAQHLSQGGAGLGLNRFNPSSDA